MRFDCRRPTGINKDVMIGQVPGSDLFCQYIRTCSNLDNRSPILAISLG